MKVIDCYSGGGGAALAAQLLGHEVVQLVEFNDYCLQSLAQRQRDGLLPQCPTAHDMREFHPTPGAADMVAAGFPCQPFSQAGLMRAEDDERNGWPDTLRVLLESGAEWGFFENVRGLLSGAHRYVDVILADLARNGFDVAWCVLAASSVGAPHQRERLWILARLRNDAGVISTVGEPYAQPFATLGDDGWISVQGSLLGEAPAYTDPFPRSGVIVDKIAHAASDLDALTATRRVQIPTPTAQDSAGSRNCTTNGGAGSTGHSGTTLNDFIHLFPTPVASDGSRDSLAYARGNPTLSGAARAWPTPTAHDGASGTPSPSEADRNTPSLAFQAAHFPTPTATRFTRNKSLGPNAKVRLSLDGMAKTGQWPTPTVQDASNNASPSQFARNTLPLNTEVFARDYPTPTARDGKGPWSTGTGSDLPGAVEPSRGSLEDSALNPQWVEWLMGWPLGWTSLEPLESIDWWRNDWWHVEPAGVPRVVDKGLANRRDRLRLLGNGQVPLCAVVAFRLLRSLFAG